MALPTYSTGTVSVAAGGTVVTNTGGMWSGINVKQGDWISINSLPAVLVIEVTDNTHLKIPPWAGAAQSNVPYIIYQNYAGRVVGVAAAEDVGDMLERLRDQAPIYNVPTGETEPDPSYGTDGQWAYQVATLTWWVKNAGVWVLSDAGPGTDPGAGVAFANMAYNGLQVNGAMAVSQEHGLAPINFPAGSVGKYPVDNWIVYKSGVNAFLCGWAYSVFPGYGQELKFTVTTAQPAISSDAILLRQAIEGYRAAPLGWGTAAAEPLTIGFWVKSSVAGSFPIYAQNWLQETNATVGVTITIAAAGVAQWVTATFPAKTSGNFRTDNGVGIYLTMYLAWSGGINIAATVGNTFEITGVIVLSGSEAPSADQSPFTMRPYDQELTLCKRYWQRLGTDIGFPVLAGYQVAGQQIYGNIHCMVPMRANPTATRKGDWSVFNCTQPFIDRASPEGITLSSVVTATGSAYFYPASNTYFSMDARFI